MDSEDEFYDTLFNEVLKSSSSDDEDDLYVAAAHIVAGPMTSNHIAEILLTDIAY
jgi:hypothetical protein